MLAPGLCQLFILLLITLSHTSHSSEISSDSFKQSLTTSTITSKEDPEMGLPGGRQQRRHWSCKERDSSGLFSQRHMDRLQDDGTSMESLSPVRLEMGPGDGMKAEVHGEVRASAHMRQGSHPAEGEFNRKGRRHGHRLLAEHRKHGGKKDKGRGKGNRHFLNHTDLFSHIFHSTKKG